MVHARYSLNCSMFTKKVLTEVGLMEYADRRHSGDSKEVASFIQGGCCHWKRKKTKTIYQEKLRRTIGSTDSPSAKQSAQRMLNLRERVMRGALETAANTVLDPHALKRDRRKNEVYDGRNLWKRSTFDSPRTKIVSGINCRQIHSAKLFTVINFTRPHLISLKLFLFVLFI